MFIKPVEGRTVPDPEHGGLLLPKGRQVEPNQYWLSRLRDGDVEQMQPAAPKNKGVTTP